MTGLQTVCSYMGVRGGLLCMYEVYRQLLTFSVCVTGQNYIQVKMF